MGRRRVGVLVASFVVMSGLGGALLVLGGDDAPEPTIPAASGWDLVWNEEFDGTALNPERWRAEDRSTFGDGNAELACLMDRPENVRVGDGVLVLRARPEDPPLRCGEQDERFPDGRDYSSAMLSTRDLADFRYGVFEVRARLPTDPGYSQGLWPAFWLRPTGGGVGELDVLEAFGTDADSAGETGHVTQTIWYDYDGTHPHESQDVDLPQGHPSDGFHTYTAVWEPGAIRWYVDGRPTFRRTSGTTPWLDEAFDRPFFLRLNLAVGGSFPGSPDERTRFPADFVVDHVRVWQR